MQSVIGFIIQNDGGDKIFVQKRSATRKSYPNTWEIPSGTTENGETEIECIKREVKEELNLDLKSVHNLIYLTKTIINRKNVAYKVYLIEVQNWQNFQLENGKADEFKWIDKNELDILNINREDGKTSPVYEAAKLFFDGYL